MNKKVFGVTIIVALIAIGSALFTNNPGANLDEVLAIATHKAEPRTSSKVVNNSKMKENNNKVSVEELKNKIEKVNKFSTDTFSDIIKYNFKNNNLDNQVYSPYSYLSALELISNNAEFNKDNELNLYKGLNVDKLVYPNVKTESLGLINDSLKPDIKKVKSLSNFKSVKFPAEAQSESKKLQKRILDEVLLEPKYDTSLDMVLLNATRFQGVWTNVFDKNITEKSVSFFGLDGKESKVEMMASEDLTQVEADIAYEDKDVQIYKKSVTTQKIKDDVKSGKIKDKYDPAMIPSTGDVYIIVPKGLTKDLQANQKIIEKVAGNINNYINNYYKIAVEYDKIFVDMPRLDIKSDIPLYKVAEFKNNKFINDNYNFNKSLGLKSSMGISDIVQVASLKLDEEQIDAKAVTEIMMKSSAPINEKIMHIRAVQPYFLVITSRNGKPEDDMKDTIIFMSLVNNPGK